MGRSFLRADAIGRAVLARAAHAGWRFTPTRIKVAWWRRHEQHMRRKWGWQRDAEVYAAAYGLAVTAGPFRGMRYPPEAVRWEQGPLATVLPGVYERELHPFLGRPSVFIDVGSAYGYYLVGMALRGARCYGFEIDPVRRRASRRLARLNGVAANVTVGKQLRPQGPAAIPGDDALLLCDIEGAETKLFTPSLACCLKNVRVIVEFHNGSERSVSDVLAATHDIEIVMFDGRVGEEGRRSDQHWGIFTPRASADLHRSTRT